MRKLASWGIVLCLACLGWAQQDFSKVQIKVIPVATGVYMLQGAGGNIGVSVGEDGIVIVDDQFAPLAEKIQAALKGITDKPVRFVINTHWHGDHTGGNAYWQKQGPILAHENVRERLSKGGTVGTMQIPPASKDALPIITFDHRATIHLNGEDIRAIHFHRGHTDGDSIIFFPHANVVHMGDDYVRYGFPFVDLDSGGSVQGMIASLDEVIPQLPPDVKIIPGHGDLSNLQELREFQQMLKETTAKIAAGVKQGKSVEQLKQEKVLAGYEKWSPAKAFINTDKWIETVYNDLKNVKPNEFVRHN
jgi:glyoxylase-like metal-dependent hydrolase (beta-lactamase superfamily II)